MSHTKVLRVNKLKLLSTCASVDSLQYLSNVLQCNSNLTFFCFSFSVLIFPYGVEQAASLFCLSYVSLSSLVFPLIMSSSLHLLWVMWCVNPLFRQTAQRVSLPEPVLWHQWAGGTVRVCVPHLPEGLQVSGVPQGAHGGLRVKCGLSVHLGGLLLLALTTTITTDITSTSATTTTAISTSTITKYYCFNKAF